MVKVKLKGTQQQQFQFGNSFYAGGTTVDLTKEEIKNYKDVIEEILEDKPELKTAISKKYTEKELIDMKKIEQIAVLSTLTSEKAPSTEKERVKLILKLQGE